jgi:hypothetical protein
VWDRGVEGRVWECASVGVYGVINEIYPFPSALCLFTSSVHCVLVHGS